MSSIFFIFSIIIFVSSCSTNDEQILLSTTNNKNLYNAKKKVDQLNKASGFDKFVGGTVGGGVGAVNTICYVEIMTTGNAIDFGDL